MIAVLALFALSASGCDENIRPAAAALQRNDLQTANAILESERSRCGHSAWFYELVGVVHLRNNKAVEAIKALEQSAAIDPADSRVLFTLGTLLAQRGMYATAVEYLRKIPDAEADEAAYFNLGLAYSHLKQLENARRSYFRAIDKRPDHVEAYFRVGLDYAATGDSRKAVPWLFRARELSGDRPDIAYSLAEQLLALRYFKTAEEVLGAGLEKNPQDPLLTVASGDVDQKMQNRASAAAKYRQALDRQPSLVAALVGLARLGVEEGKEDEAQRYLLDALKIEPTNPLANGELGVILLHREDWDSATAHLKIAWDQDRSSTSFGLELARALRHAGQYNDALRLLKTIQPANDDSTPLHLELAQVYSKLRKLSDAQAEREIVARLEEQSHDGLRFETPQIYVH
jgi:tetratricopeptide (TPR) repeat protein